MTSADITALLSGNDVPSRTIMVSKHSLTNSHASKPFESFKVVHYDDIRDAIESVLLAVRDKTSDSSCRLSTAVAEPAYHKSQPVPLILDLDNKELFGNLKMNQLFEVREVMFACTSSVQQYINDNQSNPSQLLSACVMVTIAFDTQEMVDFEIVDPLIAEIERNLTNYGPVLAKSELKRDVKTGATFKFFAEFYRVQDCQSFMAAVSDIKVEFEIVNYFALQSFRLIMLKSSSKASICMMSTVKPSSSLRL